MKLRVSNDYACIFGWMKGGLDVNVHSFNPTLTLLSARGPLADMHALDVMWVSFYSIGILAVAMLIVMANRKWVKNGCLYSLIQLVAFLLFLLGTFLMVLVVFTWPA